MLDLRISQSLSVILLIALRNRKFYVKGGKELRGLNHETARAFTLRIKTFVRRIDSAANAVYLGARSTYGPGYVEIIAHKHAAAFKKTAR